MITPLYRAVEHDHIEAVKLLIEHGADYINIHKALSWRTGMAVLNYLVDHGCDFDGMYNLSDNTALHRAIRNDSYYVCQLLVCNGADIEARNDNGNTPLLATWRHGYDPNCGIISLLLDRGADINAINTKTGDTLLHSVARLRDCVDVVRLLLNRGADPRIKNKKGATVLHVAEGSCVYMIARAMKDMSTS